MLYFETIGKSTLDLLRDLQNKEYLKGFYLAGGTALALRIGHRKSVDIDLFANFSFEADQMLESLSNDFKFHLFQSSANSISGSIGNVHVDIIAHRYPLVHDPYNEDIRMLSVEDIIAMKLNAITTSGQRIKDFIDIYFLFDDYNLSEMLTFYKK